MAKGNSTHKNESKVGKRGKAPMTPDRLRKIEGKKLFIAIAEAAFKHDVQYKKMASVLGVTINQFYNYKNQENTSFPDSSLVKLMKKHFGKYTNPDYVSMTEGEYWDKIEELENKYEEQLQGMKAENEELKQKLQEIEAQRKHLQMEYEANKRNLKMILEGIVKK